MEMIVVMIISAIVVSMAYVVFTKVNVLSMKLRLLYQANYRLILFDKLLYTDVAHAEYIQKTAEGFICVYKQEQHEYRIQEDIIRIQGSQTDTFAFFKDVVVQYAYLNDKNSIVKAITIEALSDEEAIHLLYAKEYGADVLVNDHE
jgi:hypothetical protein